MADDHEERIRELEEDRLALGSGLEDFYTRLEACAEVLAIVIQRTTIDGQAASDLANALDRLIETKRMMTTQGDKAGTAWLVQIREDLMTWHRLEPAVVRSIADGKWRPIPRNRLKLVTDDVNPSPEPEKPPGSAI